MLDGPLFPVKVRFVSQKYLNRIAAAKNETVSGCYVSSENLIYIADELSADVKNHVLGHELYHAFIEHTKQLKSEEDQADAFGGMLMRLLGDISLISLLKWV